MGNTTGISWADATHNFWYGCQKVSPGCKGCYAEREMTRYGKYFSTVTRAKGFRHPVSWHHSKRIFINSWSDFFIKQADAWRPEAWEVIRQTPQHTYMILTKRPERIAAHLPEGWPWPHVWMGVSVESQAYHWRIDALRDIPAAVRFLSCEPLLEDLRPINLRGIDWVIIGCESGPRRRPMALEWARYLLVRCHLRKIACWIKQIEQHGKVTETLAEFPLNLQCRQFPDATRMQAPCEDHSTLPLFVEG